jgi:hypothetical protein
VTAAQAYERRLTQILLAPDPGRALAAAAVDRRLPPSLRRAFAVADPDGVRLTALLVARLRFERLLRGCPEAELAFKSNPAAFTAIFGRYHRQVPPSAFFPAAEATLFRGWFSAPGWPRRRAPRRRGASPGGRRSGPGVRPSP